MDNGAIYWESRKAFGERTDDGLECRGFHGTSKQSDVQWVYREKPGLATSAYRCQSRPWDPMRLHREMWVLQPCPAIFILCPLPDPWPDVYAWLSSPEMDFAAAFFWGGGAASLASGLSSRKPLCLFPQRSSEPAVRIWEAGYFRTASICCNYFPPASLCA